MKKIHFIGAGNMAYTLAGAFDAQIPDVQIGAYDPSEERLSLFQKSFKSVQIYTDINKLSEEADILFLAVKPQVMQTVLNELKDYNKIVISIAAGIKLDTLSSALPESKTIRVMPNTPCFVQEMAAGCVFSANVTQEEKNEIMQLLSYAGTAIEVTESQMDAVTGLSGSGPAFVARLIQSFANAGIELGLSSTDSMQLTLATFSGTANLLKKQNLTPDELVAMVSSPNGTTVAGREVLESSTINQIIKNTIHAAAKRSEELGK